MSNFKTNNRRLKFMTQFLLSFVVATMLAVPVISNAANSRVDYVRKQLILSGFSAVKVNKLIGDKRVRLYPVKVVAYKQPDWKKIEQKLYSPASLQNGADYIKANQAVFEQAEKDFGVPKEALAGLIAIETDFGKSAGDYVIFNMLYSRLTHWPEARWKGQATELIALSKYCLQSKVDCFGIKGSYAGAFGLVQFMPSSLLAYGVDGNGDGIIDLSQPVDAIPSAANFLKAHGWADDQLKSLARYYGSSEGYPNIVLTYASFLAK